jgi:hypothetical protein
MRTTRTDALAFFRKHALKAALAVVAVVVTSLLLGTSVTTLLLALVLIVVASFSTFYYNYLSVPVHFELVKLSTILMAYQHGAIAGLLVGVLATIGGKVLIGRIDEKLPISVGAISVLAVLAAAFSGADIVTLGVALVALYNVSMFAISMALGGDFGWNLPYEGTNFMFNFILFTRIAPMIIG